MADQQTNPKKLYTQIGILVGVLAIIMLILINQNNPTADTTSTLPPVDTITTQPDGSFFNKEGQAEVVRRAGYKPSDSTNNASGSNPFDRLQQ